MSGAESRLYESGLGSVSINVRITAVRKLAVEAADNGLLAPELAAGIARIKGVRSQGVRTGNWLSLFRLIFSRQFNWYLRKPIYLQASMLRMSDGLSFGWVGRRLLDHSGLIDQPFAKSLTNLNY